MNHLLESKIQREGHDYLNIIFIGYGNFTNCVLKAFVRYVVDISAVFENEEEEHRFLNYLNSLHPSINFTCDKEISDKLP